MDGIALTVWCSKLCLRNWRGILLRIRVAKGRMGSRLL